MGRGACFKKNGGSVQERHHHEAQKRARGGGDHKLNQLMPGGPRRAPRKGIKPSAFFFLSAGANYKTTAETRTSRRAKQEPSRNTGSNRQVFNATPISHPWGRERNGKGTFWTQQKKGGTPASEREVEKAGNATIAKEENLDLRGDRAQHSLEEILG